MFTAYYIAVHCRPSFRVCVCVFACVCSRGCVHVRRVTVHQVVYGRGQVGMGEGGAGGDFLPIVSQHTRYTSVHIRPSGDPWGLRRWMVTPGVRQHNLFTQE
jgi:hypothetical protein